MRYNGSDDTRAGDPESAAERKERNHETVSGYDEII